MQILEDKLRKIHQTIPVRLGEQIRKFRKQKRLTQTELAELIGKDRQYMYKIEKGRVASNLITISTIACALEISLSELFEEINL